jgi:hypothetical protein
VQLDVFIELQVSVAFCPLVTELAEEEIITVGDGDKFTPYKP